MLAWRVCAATSFIRFTAKAPPTRDTHFTRGRCFNAEKVKLFNDIKQPSRYSSHLAFRNSLLITLSREMNFTPTLNRRRYVYMARLRSNIFYKIHGYK